MTAPRLFALDRREDVTGASGTGRVALGVQWPDGTCVIRWQTELRSTVVYDNVADLVAIHGHDGRTVVTWLDDKPITNLDLLNHIAKAARYYVQPDDCDGTDCNHDDDVCAHMETRYATTEQALAAARVPLLETERERLLTRAAKAGDLELAVAEALGLPASTSTDDLINQVVRLQKLADANGRNSRFWSDHFREVDLENRRALGVHHRRGNRVSELITELVAEVDRLTSERDTAREELASFYSATRHLAGMFWLDPEDHQALETLQRVGEQLAAWRTDASRVPEGWQSLVRSGWSAGPDTAVPAETGGAE
jgi:hypothetical protein